VLDVKAAVEDDPVTAEGVISFETEKRLIGCKEDGMVRCVVQERAVLADPNPTKLTVQVAGERWLSKSHPQRARNCFAWIVLRNNDLFKKGRLSLPTARQAYLRQAGAGYQKVNNSIPPETFSTMPVMYLALSETKKTMALATSSGSPAFRNAVRLANLSLISAGMS